MVPRIYSQNNAVRLSAKMLFLSKLRHLKKLTALVAFVSIFSFQGFSQGCPSPISVECEVNAVADAITAAEAAVVAALNCSTVTTGAYLVGEVAFVLLDLPTTYTQQYDGQEWGVFLYVVKPIIKRKIFC